jgi:MraZ protein
MIGNFTYSIDNKGRLMMPSKLRHQLGGELFLSLGFEKTIELRTKEDFDQ